MRNVSTSKISVDLDHCGRVMRCPRLWSGCNCGTCLSVRHTKKCYVWGKWWSIWTLSSPFVWWRTKLVCSSWGGKAMRARTVNVQSTRCVGQRSVLWKAGQQRHSIAPCLGGRPDYYLHITWKIRHSAHVAGGHWMKVEWRIKIVGIKCRRRPPPAYRTHIYEIKRYDIQHKPNLGKKIIILFVVCKTFFFFHNEQLHSLSI